jgi:hypothetical protein
MKMKDLRNMSGNATLLYNIVPAPYGWALILFVFLPAVYLISSITYVLVERPFIVNSSTTGLPFFQRLLKYDYRSTTKNAVRYFRAPILALAVALVFEIYVFAAFGPPALMDNANVSGYRFAFNYIFDKEKLYEQQPHIYLLDGQNASGGGWNSKQYGGTKKDLMHINAFSNSIIKDSLFFDQLEKHPSVEALILVLNENNLLRNGEDFKVYNEQGHAYFETKISDDILQFVGFSPSCITDFGCTNVYSATSYFIMKAFNDGLSGEEYGKKRDGSSISLTLDADAFMGKYESGLQATKIAIDALARVSHDKKYDFHVVYLPTYAETNPKDVLGLDYHEVSSYLSLGKIFKDLFSETKVTYHDLTDEFRHYEGAVDEQGNLTPIGQKRLSFFIRDNI